MPDRLRVAVVGAGFMGELHARTYAECDSAELVAIADPNAEVGLDVAKNYGARHVADVQDLLDDGNVHAFTVALPDRMHVEVTSRILEAGKAVLLEKPMADTLEGARRIAEAEQRGGGRLMVGHIPDSIRATSAPRRPLPTGNWEIPYISPARGSLRER